MAEYYEQVIIRTAMDNAQVEAGFLRMQAIAENARAKNRAAEAESAREIKAIWADLDGTKEVYYAKEIEMAKAYQAETVALEKAKQTELLASVKTLEAARLAEIERVTEAQVAANAEIIASEKARNDASMMVLGANKERNAVRTIETSASGVGWFGAGVGGAGAAGAAGEEAESIFGTRARSEVAVLFREGMRGNYSRMIGSFTYLLQNTGKAMKGMMNDLFGWFGIALAAVGVVAYDLWENIKGMNKDMDAWAKEMAKPMWDMTDARRKVAEEGVKDAVEMEAHIRSLADAHMTLAEKTDVSMKALAKFYELSGKMASATGAFQQSLISLQVALGILSPEDAAAKRISTSGNTTRAVEQAKLDSLNSQKDVLDAALKKANQNQTQFPDAYRQAIFAATGVNEEGQVANQAAFNRKADLAKRDQLEKEYAKRLEIYNTANEKFSDYREGFWNTAMNSTVGRWTGLAGVHNYLSADEPRRKLLESQYDELNAEKRNLDAGEAQKQKNIAAQAAYEAAMVEAKKRLDENTESLKNLKQYQDALAQKYQDNQVDAQTQAFTLGQQLNDAKAAQAHELATANAVAPTIEELAGSRFMKQLNEDYGDEKYNKNGKLIAGRFSLTTGRGPYSQAAQNYEKDLMEEKWDLENGNGGYKYDDKGKVIGLTGDAELDRKDSMIELNKLSAAGIATPEMMQRSLVENTAAIQSQLHALNAMFAGKTGWINVASISDDQ